MSERTTNRPPEKIRREVVARAAGRCEICGERSTLELRRQVATADDPGWLAMCPACAEAENDGPPPCDWEPEDEPTPPWGCRGGRHGHA